MALLAAGVIGGTFFLVFDWSAPDPQIFALPSDAPTESPPTADRQRRPPGDGKDKSKTKVIGRPVDLGALARQVSAIRGIALSGRLRSRSVEPAALADKISELAFSEQDPEEVANNEQLLIALRLAPVDIDLGGILEDLYREQVLGVYVPEEKTLYVGQGDTPSPGQQMTTAHEITHALQDQAFDLVALQEKYEDDADASLAVLSLIEGDAVLTQQLWAQEHLTSEQQQQAATESAGSGDALARAPEYLRASLFFPYTSGGFFVADLYSAGGHEAVDDAFRNPPTTSEHILHPDRYREGDAPVPTPVEAKPGPGWQRATKYAFGEFDLRQFFEVLGAGTAADAGEGWDGGQVRSWAKGDDTAVSTVLAFDTVADAAEVCDALPRWYEQVAGGRQVSDGLYAGNRDHLAVACTADRIRFALAPDATTAQRLITPPEIASP